MIADVEEHAKDTAFATVGGALELAMIKSSYDVIKKLVLTVAEVALSSTAKKMVGSATAAAGCAVADGPLPIGDIVGGVITVAGLGWSAYDIYSVTKTMPDEMKREILKQIDEVRKALDNTATENMLSDRDACLKSAESRLQELYKLIN